MKISPRNRANQYSIVDRGILWYYIAHYGTLLVNDLKNCSALQNCTLYLFFIFIFCILPYSGLNHTKCDKRCWKLSNFSPIIRAWLQKVNAWLTHYGNPGCISRLFAAIMRVKESVNELTSFSRASLPHFTFFKEKNLL